MLSFEDILPRIKSAATAADMTGDWPAADLTSLAAAGAMRWALPKPFGDDLSSLELHLKYESLAAASLTTALIFSQRDSAVLLIEASQGFVRREEMLRQFAANEIWTTIGIAQLTTSRQLGAPALLATPAGDGYRLDGVIPWSTGAAKSDYVVAGASLPDRRQILFCLPTDLPDMTIDPPMPLVALRATWTAQVRLAGVQLDRSMLLRPPHEKVLAAGPPRRKGVPFGQVFFALGLCRSAIDLIAAHSSDAAARAKESFETELTNVREKILTLSTPGQEERGLTEAAPLRAAVNDLAIRITHTGVALYKGAALLIDHPAQRLAREAMFLLVWSCPGAVIDCTVDRLMEC